jgi:tyrosine-protein kinase Etk/Wzc
VKVDEMTEQVSYGSQNQSAMQEAPLPEGDSDAPRRSVIEVLTELALRKWLIAKVTGISILIGLILCFALPIRYTACTSIMPPKQAESTTSFLNAQLGMGSLADAAGGAGGLLKDPNAIYLGLLKSRPVADAIINQFGLTKIYHVKDMTGARQKLKDNTEIVSEKSTLVSISVTDKDKKRAADMANAYTEQLRVLSKTISFTEASRRRLFFEEQVKDQKEKLIAAEVTFQQVQQNKGLIQLGAQADVIIGSLAGIRSQIAAKEVQLQALRSYSTEHNSDVQLAERELSSMQGEAAQMEQHGQTAGSSDMGLRDVPRVGLEYTRAERDVQYQQALFDALMRQYEAARLDESKESTVIQVVEPAIEPDRKSAPKRWLLMMFSAVSGFYLACFVAWVQIRFERQPPKYKRELTALKAALLRR